ncbi:MAG: C40 family peptidase [Gemmatimonadales bacterium]
MTARLVVACLLLVAQGCASASVGGNRFLAAGGPDLSALTLANERDLIGPVDYETRAVFRNGAHGRAGALFGLGADLTILSGQAGMPYLIGGVDVGVGTRDHPNTWSSWSVGVGGQVLVLGPLGIRAEGRYRRMTAEQRRGVEIGIRVGRAWTNGTRTDRVAPPARVPLALVPLSPAAAGEGRAGEVRASAVNLALEAMGTPYRWGGTDANGFDCSGLIQYAYGEQGVALPRRSADQARAGVELPRELAALLPGDLLTFVTTAGSVVSHVGLYVGDGRFIHSATGGVQVSLLSPTDPYGRWWWERWVGARRVVE